MPTIAWNPEHDLNQPQMDATHRGFIDRLGALQDAVANAPHEALAVLDELILHTVEHFDQEERWLTVLGFDAQNCHALQHASVLQVAREARRRHAESADLALLGVLVQALDEWFGVHAPTMDAALAQTMAERGLDPATGIARVRAEPGAAPMTGCGSTACA
jgi:hemerythrin